MQLEEGRYVLEVDSVGDSMDEEEACDHAAYGVVVDTYMEEDFHQAPQAVDDAGLGQEGVDKDMGGLVRLASVDTVGDEGEDDRMGEHDVML